MKIWIIRVGLIMGMCGVVCVIPEMASGCVMSPFLREWTLRLLVWELQFLQWESEQSRRSGVDPKGQERVGLWKLFCGRGVRSLIVGCGICRGEENGCRTTSTVSLPSLQEAA